MEAVGRWMAGSSDRPAVAMIAGRCLGEVSRSASSVAIPPELLIPSARYNPECGHPGPWAVC